MVFRQLNFLQHTKLGYDKEHILTIHIGYDEILTRYATLKTGLLSLPEVDAISASSQLPSQILTGENIDVQGGETHEVNYVSIDQDFFETLGIPIIAGTVHISALDTNRLNNKYILSQSALKELGWQPEKSLGENIVIRHGNMEPGPRPDRRCGQ